MCCFKQQQQRKQRKQQKRRREKTSFFRLLLRMTTQSIGFENWIETEKILKKNTNSIRKIVVA